MAVSMNRAEMSLKSVQNDTMRSCATATTTTTTKTHDDRSHFEIKSVIMPLRNSSNFSGSTGPRGGCDQTSTNRQPISAQTHSYSSDSDIVPSTTTTTTPSATAMRRLYFKSAKLNKTTSITTVHQQQAQHVPKVT